jgi:ribosome modulation factor
MVRTKPPADDGEITSFSGSNVTDEVSRDYYKKALRTKQEVERTAEIAKTAVAEHRLVLKAAKAAGVSNKAIIYALSVRHLDKDVLIQNERAKARMLALSGVWPSIQEDFFNILTPPADLQNETTIDMAYDNGHQCGIKGENRSINPHHQGTEKWDAWDRGWLTGQGSNVEKIAPKNKRPSKKDIAAAFAATEMAPDSAEEDTETKLFD